MTKKNEKAKPSPPAGDTKFFHQLSTLQRSWIHVGNFLKKKEDDRFFTIRFRMPLNGNNVRSAPHAIQTAYAVIEGVGLEAKRNSRAASLSHGDQRKLEVAMMMALEPDIFMFDEPTAGMSVDEVPVVLDLIARLKKDKEKTILLVEHKMDVVRSLADRIIVLHNGRLAADGEPSAVIASPIVQEAYLGVARGGAS